MFTDISRMFNYIVLHHLKGYLFARVVREKRGINTIIFELFYQYKLHKRSSQFLYRFAAQKPRTNNNKVT